MSFARIQSWLMALGCALLFSGTIIAETKYSGELGLDFQFHSYGADRAPTGPDHDLQRAISNHFVRASFKGPLVNETLGHYSITTKLRGVYLRSYTAEQKASTYINPSLNSLVAQTTLFPERSYNIKLLYSLTKSYALLYEPGNREDTRGLRPELATIRQYDSDKSSLGAGLDVALSQHLKVSTQFTNRKSAEIRVYPFDENVDLYTQFILSSPIRLPLLAAPNVDKDTSWTIGFGLVNKVKETGISVFISWDPVFQNQLGIVDTLLVSANSTNLVNITLDYQIGQYNDQDSDPRNNYVEFIEDFVSSPHFMDIVPDSIYNSNTSAVIIEGEMQIIFDYIDPIGKPDQDNLTNSFLAGISYDNDKNIRNTLGLSVISKDDKVQNTINDQTSISNNLSYGLNESIKLDMISALTSLQRTFGEGKLESSSSFGHETRLSYSDLESRRVMLSHSLATSSLQQDTIREESFQNSIKGSGSMPSGFKDHEVGVAISLTSTSGTKTTSSTNSGMIKNSISAIIGGVLWMPQNTLTTSVTKSGESPASGRLASVTDIQGQLPSHRLLGSLRISAQHNYSKLTSDLSDRITTMYTFQLGTIYEITSEIKLSLGLGQLYTGYGGFSITPEIESIVDADTVFTSVKTAVIQPSESGINYRIAIDASLLNVILLYGSQMVSNVGSSTTIKRMASLSATIPGTPIVISSNLNQEVRITPGLSDQVKLSLESEFGLSIRKIRISFEHVYHFEERFDNKLTYSLIEGKVSRTF